MVVLLAVLSAASNAASTVLQRMAAATAPPTTAMRLSLLGYLIHRRVWLVGMAAMVVSFLLQAAALDHGALAVVQPLLIAKLPLTALFALLAFRGQVRITVGDWLIAIAMSGGLALVLIVAAPTSAGRPPTGFGWAVTVVGAAAVLTVLFGLARRHPGAPRAALLGAGSGLAFGLTAAFIKGVTDHLGSGIGGLFGSWALYATAVVGALAVLLQQSSLQAGSLAASQPTSMIVGTLVSVMLGIVLFDEHVRVGGVWPAELIGIGLVVASVFAAAHSPLVSASAAPEAEGRADGAGRGRRSAGDLGSS